MSTVSTKIIFPAILEVDQFAIEIELVDSATGLHYFKVAKILPHLGANMVASAVAECELQIDLFWNILAYVRDTIIRTTGKVLYEANGQVQEFNSIARPSLTAKLVGVASERWFDDKIPLFHKNYDLDLLKRFNFARMINEPIGKFVSLYALLASRCRDNQIETDKLIETIDPSVGKSLSPKTGKSETIFTRLRNELAHNRTGMSIIETHKSVYLHLPRFEWIVKVVVTRTLEAV
jgi:hypothetical protein